MSEFKVGDCIEYASLAKAHFDVPLYKSKFEIRKIDSLGNLYVLFLTEIPKEPGFPLPGQLWCLGIPRPGQYQINNEWANKQTLKKALGIKE